MSARTKLKRWWTLVLKRLRGQTAGCFLADRRSRRESRRERRR